MDKKTASKFAQALGSIGKADVIPEGWATAREIADSQGVSMPHMQKKIRALVESDKAEMQRFKIKTSRGFYPVPHYRIK
jgi:DNA-binding IscR family transcriptional regulator